MPPATSRSSSTSITRPMFAKKCFLSLSLAPISLCCREADNGLQGNGLTNLCSHNGSYRWRKRISNLAITGCLPAHKFPAVRDALKFGNHLHGEFRHAGKVRGGRFIGNADAVYAEFSPSLSSPRRPEVRTTMLLRSADDRRRDPVCLFLPGLGKWPATFSHVLGERFAHRLRRNLVFLVRPLEAICSELTDCNKEHAGSQLRHAEVGSV